MCFIVFYLFFISAFARCNYTWLWKGVSATLWSGRYTLSHLRGRYNDTLLPCYEIKCTWLTSHIVWLQNRPFHVVRMKIKKHTFSETTANLTLLTYWALWQSKLVDKPGVRLCHHEWCSGYNLSMHHLHSSVKPEGSVCSLVKWADTAFWLCAAVHL